MFSSVFLTTHAVVLVLARFTQNEYMSSQGITHISQGITHISQGITHISHGMGIGSIPFPCEISIINSV